MNCPGCSVEWGPRPDPEPGEPTVCEACGTLSLFTDGGVRAASETEEADAYDQYPYLEAVVAAIRWELLCRKVRRYQRSRLN